MRISDWSSDVCSSDLFFEQFLVDQLPGDRMHDVAGSCVAGVFVGADVYDIDVEVGPEPFRGQVHDRRLAGTEPADETYRRRPGRVDEILDSLADRIGNDLGDRVMGDRVRLRGGDRPRSDEPAVPPRRLVVVAQDFSP